MCFLDLGELGLLFRHPPADGPQTSLLPEDLRHDFHLLGRPPLRHMTRDTAFSPLLRSGLDRPTAGGKHHAEFLRPMGEVTSRFGGASSSDN